MVTKWPPNVWMGVRDPWGRPTSPVRLNSNKTKEVDRTELVRSLAKYDREVAHPEVYEELKNDN